MRPGRRQERVDQYSFAFFYRPFVDKLGHRQIEHSQSERAEDSYAFRIPLRSGSTTGDVRDSTPDELARAYLLLSQVNRCLSAAHMVHVIHNVVA
jgi:hypothetical protein